MIKSKKELVEKKSIRFFIMYNCSNCGQGDTICLGDYSNPQYWNGERIDECSECYYPSGIRIKGV